MMFMTTLSKSLDAIPLYQQGLRDWIDCLYANKVYETERNAYMTTKSKRLNNWPYKNRV